MYKLRMTDAHLLYTLVKAFIQQHQICECQKLGVQPRSDFQATEIAA